jgi:hypothetical protein
MTSAECSAGSESAPQKRDDETFSQPWVLDRTEQGFRVGVVIVERILGYPLVLGRLMHPLMVAFWLDFFSLFSAVSLFGNRNEGRISDLANTCL